MRTLYTIGHSTHTMDRLLELLSFHSISAIADVRSSPFSRYNPQFNREPLQNALRTAGVEYVFLGKELGARCSDPSCHINGKVEFGRVARTSLFQSGLQRLRSGIDSFVISLLCAEKDPIVCHRMILVCRAMRSDSLGIRHILENGDDEDNRDAEMRLRKEHGIDQSDFFENDATLLEKAYDLQAAKIAYTEKADE